MESVHFFFSASIYLWDGFVSLWAEQRHFTSQTEGQGPLRQPIVYDYNKNNKKQRLDSKKQIQDGVRIGSSL